MNEQPIKDWRNDPTIPVMKPVEKGRLFAPNYETETRDFDVKTEEWEHVCSCRFGPGRPLDHNPKACWSGNSYRYDIFQKKPKQYSTAELERLSKVGLKPQTESTIYALRWSHGGGDGWFLQDTLCNKGFNLLVMISRLTSEPDRWDACHFIAESLSRTASAESRRTARRYSEAFVNGRLKKRKKRGTDSYTVEIMDGV